MHPLRQLETPWLNLWPKLRSERRSRFQSLKTPVPTAFLMKFGSNRSGNKL
jgi:hypothetical protein